MSYIIETRSGFIIKEQNEKLAWEKLQELGETENIAGWEEHVLLMEDFQERYNRRPEVFLERVANLNVSEYSKEELAKLLIDCDKAEEKIVFLYKLKEIIERELSITEEVTSKAKRNMYQSALVKEEEIIKVQKYKKKYQDIPMYILIFLNWLGVVFGFSYLYNL